MQSRGAWVLGVLGLVAVAACGGRSLEVAGEDGGASVGVVPSVGGAPSASGAPSAGAPTVAGAPSVPFDPNQPPVPPGDRFAGEQIFRSPMVACSSCHGEKAAGLFAPNITRSTTAGIGAWSYREFYDAVRFSQGRNGRMLCIFMVPFDSSVVSEQGIADIYAFLGTTLSDVPNRGTYCP